MSSSSSRYVSNLQIFCPVNQSTVCENVCENIFQIPMACCKYIGNRMLKYKLSNDDVTDYVTNWP
jgi:hypothetical protein